MTRSPLWNIVERLLWTAVQAFIGSLPVTLSLTTQDARAVGASAATAALSAIISAAKNLTAEATVRQAALRAMEGTAAEVRDS